MNIFKKSKKSSFTLASAALVVVCLVMLFSCNNNTDNKTNDLTTTTATTEAATEATTKEITTAEVTTNQTTVEVTTQAPKATQPVTKQAAKNNIQHTTQDPDKKVTVYITRTGEKYHYENPCGNGKYYASNLADAKSRGLGPCEKCVLH